jgi:hypothetical protein
MKWSGGDSFGFMTANAIRFGSDLLAKFEAFSQLRSKISAWCDINVHTEPIITLLDHLLESMKVFSMVWR